MSSECFREVFRTKEHFFWRSQVGLRVKAESLGKDFFYCILHAAEGEPSDHQVWVAACVVSLIYADQYGVIRGWCEMTRSQF